MAEDSVRGFFCVSLVKAEGGQCEGSGREEDEGRTGATLTYNR